MLISDCPPLMPPSPHLASLHAQHLVGAGNLCTNRARQQQRGQMGFLPLLIAGALATPLLSIWQMKQQADLAKKAEKLEAKRAKAEAEAQAKADAQAAVEAKSQTSDTTKKILIYSGIGLGVVVAGVVAVSILRD